jgi:hypothetical protein
VGAVELKNVQISDMVSTHNQEILSVEIALGIFHTASGSKLGFLMHIGYLDTKKGTITKSFLDRVPHIAKSEDNFPESQVGEM